uniref:BRCT domain-containing protein n=1 Tax=Neogobius melanostomus TaxID=47308 RepID=A0A8C6UK87_9GOBI
MSEEENKVSEELFKDVKFYVVGDIDQEVRHVFAGKEVSYNALATHIIAEDGDNPEVSESREVFDLPVVKPSWVILSVRCGDLLPVTGFSPESGQIFFGVTACLPRVGVTCSFTLNLLWKLKALITSLPVSCLDSRGSPLALGLRHFLRRQLSTQPEPQSHSLSGEGT